MLANNDRLTVMASIDMLSGLANRRGFQSRLDFEWMKAQQYGSELSLLMIDVDHFKLYNDTYGHPEGDACLTRLGETLAGTAAATPWSSTVLSAWSTKPAWLWRGNRRELRCRPGEGRDPYAAAEIGLRDGCRLSLSNKQRWLWAPAFAGATTYPTARSASSSR